MKTAVIFNPKADHGQAKKAAEHVISLIKKQVNPIIKMTQRPGHAVDLAKEAVNEGIDLLIAVGGDGTVNETANGMVVGRKTDATLGIIPIGSGNDLAFNLGITKNPDEAVSAIFEGRRRLIDLARIKDNRDRSILATNGIGIGFDATVTIQSTTITRVHGFPMYLLAALRTIALYFQAPPVRLGFDEEKVEQQMLLLAIGLGKRVGGGFYLTPDAVHDDDLLDSCTVYPVSRATMLMLLPRVMRGTHVSSNHVKMRRSHRIEINSEIPLPIHVDGEIFAYPEDNVRQLSISSLASALPVMIPAD